MKRKSAIYLFLIALLILLVGCGKTTKASQTTKIPTTASQTTTSNTTTSKTTIPTTVSQSTTLSTESNMVELPDLTGKNREEINEIFSELGLEIKYLIDNNQPYNQDGSDYGKFVKYSSKLQAGSKVEKGSVVNIYTAPLELPEIKASLELKLTVPYTKESNFITDGIGIVTVAQHVDGDTTIFRQVDGQTFTVRYLGIDTPESTFRFDPWGKEAAKYTKDLLDNAKEIVLQAEGERKDGNGRYLAWVWADGVLVNLRLVEVGYSQAKVAKGTSYTDIINTVDYAVSSAKRRVYGEKDPNYDYSRDGVEISIKDLTEHFDECVGVKVIITGTITRKVGEHPYIEQDGYGMYLYIGYVLTSQLEIGNNVTIQGLVPTYHYEDKQLSNFILKNLTVNSENNTVTAKEKTLSELSEKDIYSLIKINNLTVTYINDYNNAVTINCKDSNNNTMTIRIDVSLYKTVDISNLKVGSIINVTGPLEMYNGKYQIMLTLTEDLEIIK